MNICIHKNTYIHMYMYIYIYIYITKWPDTLA